jgi:hypothetical protein
MSFIRTVGSRILREIIGEERFGALQYRRSPEMGRSWGGPMNGQGWRCRLVAELIVKTQSVALFETGTYLGATTEWLAAFQLPIYTCELSSRYFGFSKERLRRIENVHILNIDSRTALRNTLGGPLMSMREQPIFFYLDAHWNSDLPLAEEIDIIFSSAPSAIVLVDDFEVPGDPGYGFDDYGGNSALNWNYISNLVELYALEAFFPSTPSELETGARRGCVILAKRDRWASILEADRLLRRH